MNRKITPAQREEIQRITEAAAEKVATITYDDLNERVGRTLWGDLADLMEKTESAYISGKEHRREDAELRATFAIGLAVGRRLR